MKQLLKSQIIYSSFNSLLGEILIPLAHQTPDLFGSKIAERKYEIDFYSICIGIPDESFCCVKLKSKRGKYSNDLFRQKIRFMKDINGAIDIRPSTTTKHIAIKKDWLNDPTYSINNEMKYIGEINFVEFINYKNKMKYIGTSCKNSAQVAIAYLSCKNLMWMDLKNLLLRKEILI